VVLKFQAKNTWGDWADAVCTQVKEFVPIYMIPDYDIV